MVKDWYRNTDLKEQGALRDGAATRNTLLKQWVTLRGKTVQGLHKYVLKTT